MFEYSTYEAENHVEMLMNFQFRVPKRYNKLMSCIRRIFAIISSMFKYLIKNNHKH